MMRRRCVPTVLQERIDYYIVAGDAKKTLTTELRDTLFNKED